MKYSILYLDDNEQMLRLFGRMFGEEYDVRTAGRAKDAFGLLQERPRGPQGQRDIGAPALELGAARLRAIETGHIDKGMIDVEMFSKHLYTRYYPDPDLLIRTSGEMRLSNFLLWQLSYTEMYVTPKLWPDFTKKDLFAAVEEFSRRQRRYGAV